MNTTSKDTVSRWREEGGARLRKARLSARGGKGYTLREVHEAMGDFSVSRLHGYEAGYRGMTPDVAHKLGTFLGVPAAHLLCVDEPSDDAGQFDQADSLMLAKWRAAPEVVRTVVADILTRYV